MSNSLRKVKGKRSRARPNAYATRSRTHHPSKSSANRSKSRTSPSKPNTQAQSHRSRKSQPLDEADRFLIKWLQDNSLKHIYTKISNSQIDIIQLSKCDESTIHDTAKCQLKLSGKDLSLFERSVIKYSKTQALMKRTDEVSEVIDSLEFTRNEINMKRKDDISYIQSKFKRIRQALKKRETALITDIKNKIEYKSNLLNEQILSLKQYKTKLDKQHSILMKRTLNTKKKECIQQNKKAQRLLRQNIQHDKDKFVGMNKMSVEIANYDQIIGAIETSGEIVDEWDERQLKLAHKPMASTKKVSINALNMDCTCGSALVLTNVEAAYPELECIHCNFCRNKCFLPYNGDIYHCPRGDHRRHPGGFDLCLFCGQRCMEARKNEKMRIKEERQRMKRLSVRDVSSGHVPHEIVPLNKKNIVKGRTQSVNLSLGLSSRRSKSYSASPNSPWPMNINDIGFEDFLYHKQLAGLVEMGYDQKYAAKLLVKHDGNMVHVMAA
eukprot:256724_1